MKQNYFIILAIILSFLSSSLLVADTSENETAISVLEKVKDIYSSLESYSDSGIAKNKVETSKFETKYVRSNLFSFSWISELDTIPPNINHSAIWSDGLGVYSCYRFNKKNSSGIEKEETISRAIAGATGISLGAAFRIPTLLGLTGKSNGMFIKNPVLIGETYIDGILCYHIKGEGRTELQELDLFISKSDFLIRKHVRATPVGLTEILYRSVSVNANLASSDFNLKSIIKPQVEKNTKLSLTEKLGKKLKDLQARLKSEKLKPEERDHQFIDQIEIRLRNYDTAYFNTVFKWNISDPYLYFKNVGLKTIAIDIVKDSVEYAMLISLLLPKFEMKIGEKVSKGRLSKLIEIANERMVKYKYGIKLDKLDCQLNSIVPATKR